MKHKILVSAYACEPNKGSEPGVGWNWVNQLANYYDVYVITRKNNKEIIERYSSNNNLKFYYYDLPNFFIKIKKKFNLTQLYYFFWQIGVYKLAKDLNDNENFSLAHHITFATYKTFSFLALLNIPFVFGPVGGGERTPLRFYKNYPLIGIAKELLRDLSIQLSKINPLYKYTIKKAKKILVTSKETYNMIPKKYQYKTEIYQTIGIEEISKHEKKKNDCKFNVLFVGNLIYLKGIYLVLESFKEYLKINELANLTFIGGGKEIFKLKRYIKKYCITDKVNFKGSLNREQVLSNLSNYDVLLFPSFHDSGGMVVLEAMSCGVPVVCLDLGGPGVNIKANTGFKIKPQNYQQVIKDIVQILDTINNDKDTVNKITANAIMDVEKNYLWSSKIIRLMEVYGRILTSKV